MFKKMVLLAVATIAALGFVAPADARQSRPAPNATVFVVHGINGSDLGAAQALPVDVSVNGACALKGFTFKTIAGPLSLPAGNYNIKVSLANAAAPCSNAAVIEANVPLYARENASIVAHLSAAGAPTASKFVNRRAPGHIGRYSIRHTAAAPAVDVTFATNNRRFGFALRNLTNGKQRDAFVFPGTYNVAVFPAGQRGQPVIGPAAVPVGRGETVAIYAVGSLAKGSLDVIVQTIR